MLGKLIIQDFPQVGVGTFKVVVLSAFGYPLCRVAGIHNYGERIGSIAQAGDADNRIDLSSGDSLVARYSRVEKSLFGRVTGDVVAYADAATGTDRS